MKKKLRVKKNEDFQTIIHHKTSLANKEFILYFLNKDDQDHVRIGFSVSKKLGKAVIRNKIKRQVRQMAQNVFNTNEPCDYIIIVRKGYMDNDYAHNVDSLKRLYQKKLNYKKEKMHVKRS